MRFRILNRDPVYDYREECKLTQGIDICETDESLLNVKDMTAWWIKQIVANHSCIRSVRFRIIDRAPKSVIMQLIRATKGHPQPEVESSRPDWTGKERGNDPYEMKLFSQDHTAESFIEMAKQRLCNRTEVRTRKYMWVVVNSLRNCKDPFLRAVGFCSLPACLWYGGRCPEIKGCGLCPKISDEIIHAFEISVTVHEGQCLNVEGTKELNEKGYVNVKFEYGKELEDKNV